MKLAIIGSRTATDYTVLCHAINTHFTESDDDGFVHPIFSEIISGGARGADSLGARWATEHNIKLTVFEADWDKHGKRAGFLRNVDIIAAADMVVALWDGTSKGTQHSLSLAKQRKLPTLIIYI